MIEVTSRAQREMKAYFGDGPRRPLRLFLEEEACGSSTIEIGVDRIRSNDKRFDVDGIEIIVESYFLSKAQPIRVDYGESGFDITSAIPLEDDCESCCGCS